MCQSVLKEIVLCHIFDGMPPEKGNYVGSWCNLGKDGFEAKRKHVDLHQQLSKRAAQKRQGGGKKG